MTCCNSQQKNLLLISRSQCKQASPSGGGFEQSRDSGNGLVTGGVTNDVKAGCFDKSDSFDSAITNV